MECCKASQFPNDAGARIWLIMTITFARVIPTLLKFFVDTINLVTE